MSVYCFTHFTAASLSSVFAKLNNTAPLFPPSRQERLIRTYLVENGHPDAANLGGNAQKGPLHNLWGRTSAARQTVARRASRCVSSSAEASRLRGAGASALDHDCDVIVVGGGHAKLDKPGGIPPPRSITSNRLPLRM